MSDARFEDAMDKPLRLIAFDAEDLQVLSAMTQDAVLPMAQMIWHARERRFALLLNRFRWEAREASQAERVQSVLSFEDVKAVQTQGFNRTDPDLILSLLSIIFIQRLMEQALACSLWQAMARYGLRWKRLKSAYAM